MIASHSSDFKTQKVLHASQLLEDSPAFQRVLPLTAQEWAGVLSELDEEKIDDYLLLLTEEQSMRAEIRKTEKRKKKVNHTRYLQRLERLKVIAQESLHSPHERR